MTGEQLPLFSGAPRQALGEGATLLRAFAQTQPLLAAIATMTAPFRHMQTPSGRMSVAMTNCGAYGWVSDARGYRYSSVDPASGLPWPEIPAAFLVLAVAAANATNYGGFQPNACLVNRYARGAQMGLHQDKNEGDFSQPIVSVSIGSPATFVFEQTRVLLCDGDVVVWGGPSRLAKHGVRTLKSGTRYNLTFRVVR